MKTKKLTTPPRVTEEEKQASLARFKAIVSRFRPVILKNRKGDTIHDPLELCDEMPVVRKVKRCTVCNNPIGSENCLNWKGLP